MSADAVVTTLKSMKLHGMASAVAELAEQGSPAFKQSGELLDKLIKAEVAEREVRSIDYQMKIAKFPAHRDLAGFDFAESSVSAGQVKALHRCEFLDETENVVFVGGPGTGKTHLATAIGVQAIIHHHRRVRFLSTVELVNELEQEKLKGMQGRTANRMTHVDLVILDELGYLPFSQSYPRRTRLPAVQPVRRCLAVPLPLEALREDQPDHHHQPELRGMAECLR
jgi:DNA replication protein DnaC